MAKINRSKSQIGENHEISLAYALFLEAKKALCAKSTIKTYGDVGTRIIIPMLKEYCGDTMMDVTSVGLRAILNDYTDSHTSNGTHFIYRHMKAFINWYWSEYEIDKANPINKVTVKKIHTLPKQGITRAEVDLLIKTAKEHSVFPERDIAMIMVLSDTGIRLSSFASLKIGDVDTNKSQLLVFEKDQRYHIKAYGATCNRALKKYLRCMVEAKPEEPLWLQMDGSPLERRGLREVLKRLCSEAGIPDHLFHDFRRFYGLELYKSTHDIYFVSRALDHKDIEVTKRYLAIDEMEDADAIRAMSPMDNKNAIKIKRK